MKSVTIDEQLANDIARFYADPVGFVNWAFDWGHGPLKGYDGLDTWQEDFLNDIGRAIAERGFNGRDPVDPIQMAVASGHGPGKTALTAMIILFYMSTRPMCRGVVTSNTADQLRTRTWAEVRKWMDFCICGHWFDYSGSTGHLSISHKAHPQNWRIDAQTAREENSESFAGMHNASSSTIYLFDEASAVPDKIWDVAKGGLTDGEPIFLAFGNPTRNVGAFRNLFKDSSWDCRQIDSRTAKRTNKRLLDQWIEQYGIDSDFVRVRVLGKFPNASDDQYFPSDIVAEAMRRPLPHQVGDEPLVCGIDLSRGGNDSSVIQFRRGRDARSEKRYRIPGEKTKDSMQVSSLIATVLDRHQPDLTFIDVGSMGGPIGDRLRQLGYPVIDVGFGHKAQNERLYPNRTSEMAARLLEWLQAGGCLPDVPELEQDLTERMLMPFDARDRLVIEKKEAMKKRLGRSPDDSDALFLTFASTVARRLTGPRDDRPLGARGQSEAYHPFDRLDEVV